MAKKAIVFFVLAAIFTFVTGVFLGLTTYFTGYALYCLYGPHHDAGTVIGGLFCFLTIFPTSIVTVFSAGGVFPFTSLFQKMNGGKGNVYTKVFFIFAICAIIFVALCLIAVPVLGAINQAVNA